ncbi:MAG: Hsp70 family protein [Candidatus Methanoplasma sp.]|jgi:molecular chaperone DnaK|nr:Hsp70 family protein [Candidatus Methanoplasma sp.]
MSEKEFAIGIDLGTTYSCLAYIDDEGDSVVEKNFEQEDTTPSVILFNENGEIIVGSPAKDMAIMYPPERVVTAIKRQIGTEYEVDIDGDRYTPVTLSAAILRKIINDFNENHGTDIKRAVITCPAYFGQTERDATKLAGTVAGLEDVTIINEPTAAAISFGLGSGIDGKKRVLVYDLGGGTFDVTILEIDGKAFTAVATDGERLLGGKDWDQALTKIIKQKVIEENGIDESELDADDDVKQSLILDSETIKKRLSSAESTKGTLTVGGTKAVYTVTRAEFEAATSPLMQTTIELIERALASKEFTIGDIDEVILVGGSSRMPQVKSAITEKYPDANIRLFDPDQSIAKGAAIFAGAYNWNLEEDVAAAVAKGEEYVPAEGEISVHNVLSKSFGIKAVYDDDSEKISNIIFRNEVLPIVAIKTYFPVEDGQSSIKVEIFEDSASNNSEGKRIELIEGYAVGDFEVALPEGVNKNTPIQVKFTATDEGILVASVDCLEQHAEYQLQNKIQLSDSEIKQSQGLMEKVSNVN